MDLSWNLQRHGHPNLFRSGHSGVRELSQLQGGASCLKPRPIDRVDSSQQPDCSQSSHSLALPHQPDYACVYSNMTVSQGPQSLLQVMSCYTKDLRPIDCPDICSYERNQLHRQHEAISASAAMMVGAKLLSASDAWENKGCPPQSGTCQPTGQEA